MFAIVVHGADPVVEDSQFSIVPLYPDTDNNPLAVPEQMEAFPVKVPPREIGFTSIVNVVGVPIHPW